MSRDAARRDLLAALDARGRMALANLPTPLHRAPRLARLLGLPGEGLLLKRDDETGFALGGNKVRKLEHALRPEALGGVTRLVTAGGPQSNHCRVTAAAAARLGLPCTLVVNGAPGDPPRGNALVHRLLGAEVRIVEGREARDPAMAEVAAREADAGGRALVLPLGASTPEGALGYVRAAAELDAQLPPGGGTTRIFIAASSCGTLAGLAAGFAALGRSDLRLVGVSADDPRPALLDATARLAAGAAALVGRDGLELPTGLVEVTDAEVGGGYGVSTARSREALALFATAEGVVLDPTYTAKAAAGLVGWARDGGPEDGERVVFWHTGGHPALFA